MGLPPEAVLNEAGQVAMRYKKQSPAYVKCGNGKEYVFAVRANIAMSWIDQEDVPCMLNVRESCCGGGQRKPAVFFCDETHVRRWIAGGGR